MKFRYILGKSPFKIYAEQKLPGHKKGSEIQRVHHKLWISKFKSALYGILDSGPQMVQNFKPSGKFIGEFLMEIYIIFTLSYEFSV